MRIEKFPNNSIRVIEANGSFIESRSVEGHILFAILNKLEQIRCGIIDVESAVDNISRGKGGD